MAYELRGLLENNISIVTGENIRPSYGGDDEAFLKKVVTPIYRVIERVYFLFHRKNDKFCQDTEFFFCLIDPCDLS